MSWCVVTYLPSVEVRISPKVGFLFEGHRENGSVASSLIEEVPLF